MTTWKDDMDQITRILKDATPAAIAALLLFAATSANAQEGTSAQRNACTPDVFRLCSSYIPDPAAITSCLERNRARLSPVCQAVFAPPTR